MQPGGGGGGGGGGCIRCTPSRSATGRGGEGRCRKEKKGGVRTEELQLGFICAPTHSASCLV